jgi:three-Cys-motif partner protein
LFAGPGKNRVRGTGQVLLGSPLIALTTKYPFTHCYFSDLSVANADSLRQRCSAVSVTSQVEVQDGDCNELVDTIVREMQRVDRRSLNLAFLDPEGLQLRWETVAKLGSLERMDLIIYYPQQALTRNLHQAFDAQGTTAVDLFFGDREWRAIYGHCLEIGSGSIHRPLIDHFRGRLQALGYKVMSGAETICEPVIRNSKRNAPLYKLLFASKHPLAYDLWKKATNHNVWGQKRLFDEPGIYK